MSPLGTDVMGDGVAREAFWPPGRRGQTPFRPRRPPSLRSQDKPSTQVPVRWTLRTYGKAPRFPATPLPPTCCVGMGCPPIRREDGRCLWDFMKEPEGLSMTKALVPTPARYMHIGEASSQVTLIPF